MKYLPRPRNWPPNDIFKKTGRVEKVSSYEHGETRQFTSTETRRGFAPMKKVRFARREAVPEIDLPSSLTMRTAQLPKNETNLKIALKKKKPPAEIKRGREEKRRQARRRRPFGL